MKYIFLLLLTVIGGVEVVGQTKRFSVLVLSEDKGHHVEYSRRAKQWLDSVAVDSNFSVTYIRDTKLISKKFLKKYNLFIQLDYPPYGWSAEAAKAFQQALESGKIGWLGFHHASLLGEFDGYTIWPWFYSFMGSIRWKNYIPGFVKARVVIEDSTNP
ncbi:MAG TPA: ThuA domain-containing protein, partial [Flavitalea sp.]|nr:ThuA domain-containing protein [Flavitalea sp.]